MYLLDSNVCIRLLNQYHGGIEQRFRKLAPSDIFLCSVVKAELLYGARHSQRVESNLQKLELFFLPLGSLPFDDRCAGVYARVRHNLSISGQSIGPNDLMIAAIALASDIVLVTHNQREFGRIEGLHLEDWEA
ncbi:MAG TPA: type II toxin-antitoxin system VapC family toxin [Gammaproteobacteria bacterium]|nr:type II toxin-antitoxin system VapC family toxin [Gammaproteobacteria bacterium]